MNRVQTLRSSVTGWRPIAGTRQPGELYVNWADAAFGTIDVTQTAMDLVAVRYWSAQANYAAGSFVIYNGAMYNANVPITAGGFNPAQWTNVVGGGGAFLPLSGGTITGVFTVAAPSGDSTVTINKFASGHDAQLAGQTNGSVRWDVTLGDSSPETGGNVGSDFSINAFADNGTTLLSTPIYISRKTGLVEISTAFTVASPSGDSTITIDKFASGHDAQLAGQTNGSVRWDVTLGDNTPESGSNAGSNFSINGFADDGVTLLHTPIFISRKTGLMLLTGDPTASNGAATKAYVDAHSGGGGGIPDAPNDGQLYGRKSLAWSVVPSGGGGGIPEAPTDGFAYARKNAAWTQALPLTGGTMSGPIASGTVAADPTTALGIASKAYVDAHAGGGGSGANLLDNGDMSIAQRGTGVVTPIGGNPMCAVDRWVGYASVARYSMGQNYNGLPPPTGFSKFVGAQCTSASAAGASDYFYLQQALEGDTLNGFNWGSSAASTQSVTLSFWACSSLTGTFSGSLGNGANTRAYIFTYSLPVASTPTKITLTIPGDTGGAWTHTGPNTQMVVYFDLGSGTSERNSTINTWLNGAPIGQTGSAGIIGNNGATFYVTGVKLELASSATPFFYDPLAVRLARCQRYFQILTEVTCDGYGGQGFGSGTTYMFPMRALPGTYPLSSIVYNNANSMSVLGVSTNSLVVGANFTGTGHSYATAIAAVSAEI